MGGRGEGGECGRERMCEQVQKREGVCVCERERGESV